ncbi:hypothetical protein ABH926_005491 [Catenulispora sp. GP43]|uniref:hypothetical protein n=1 Tax=Catenulispora sp. GP43 TaxID=3156263 RepID=UPI0035122D9C
MRSVFKRFGGMAAATGIAVMMTAAPSHAAVAAGTVAPNASMVEYALGISPNATAIEYGLAVSPDATAIEYGL